MFEVTAEWINRFRSGTGGWNRTQLQLLGIEWPPVQGWIQRTAGKQIPEADARLFESLQGQTLKVLKNKRKGVGETCEARAASDPERRTKAQFRRELMAWYEQMITVATQLGPAERAELEAWERINLNGHSIGTSDWPGWQRYMPARPTRGRFKVKS